MKSLTWAVFAGAAVLCGCQTAPGETPGVVAEAGFSGLARIGANSYLGVYDWKTTEPGARIAVLEVTAEGAPRVTPIDVPGWADAPEKPTDLEAACALPGLPGEALVLESGQAPATRSRLFLLRGLSERRVEIARTLEFPSVSGQSLEGLACTRIDAAHVLLIFGERGGSAAFPDGVLRWATLDLASGALAWTEAGRAGVAIRTPLGWRGPSERAIGDLHLDDGGRLWAAATTDPGDVGPYRSAVRQVAVVDPQRSPPIEPLPRAGATFTLDGLKVEGIAAPPAAVPGALLSIASEDELLGGAFRPLSAPAE